MTTQIGNKSSKTIQITNDPGIIKELIKQDYDKVVYDGCPSWTDFEPDFEKSIWFILRQGNTPAGLIRLDSLNWVTWVPHIVISKEHRGRGSEEWGKQVIQYMKNIFKDVNFMVITPYESARNFVKRLGFKELGIMPNSIKKNGKLMDQYILTGEAE